MVARTEADLAGQVVHWLEARQWRVSQEVQLDHGPRVDIVGERPPKVWAICAKLHFGIEVIEQAFALERLAHKVSVAVPLQEKDRTQRVRLCYRLGIGILGVAPNGDVIEVQDPLALTPKRYAKIQTHPEQRSGRFARAGTQGGGQFTEFNRTKLAVLEYVAQNPRCGIKAIVDGVEHHYSRPQVARHHIEKLLEREPSVERHGKGTNASYWIEETA